MDIVPSRADRELARETCYDFSRRPGSEHIASRFALAHLSAVLRLRRPETVLEFGAGIGTITHMLLTHPAGMKRVTATEDHPTCLELLAGNIPSRHRERLDLIERREDLARLDRDFDLVIFDGEFSGANPERFFRQGSICFVEGHRSKTRATLNERLATRDLVCRFDNFSHRRLFGFVRPKNRSRGFRLPRPVINKVIKGCWVGEVASLAPGAAIETT